MFWLFETVSEITLVTVPLAAFEFVMPGLVPGIDVLSSLKQKRCGWPGHLARRRASRFCPAMTKKAVRRALGRHHPSPGRRIAPVGPEQKVAYAWVENHRGGIGKKRREYVAARRCDGLARRGGANARSVIDRGRP
jgi:hypothetical protein